MRNKQRLMLTISVAVFIFLIPLLCSLVAQEPFAFIVWIWGSIIVLLLVGVLMYLVLSSQKKE